MIINQKLNEFANDCTLASQYQILNRMYGLNIKYWMLDKTIDFALRAKVLFEWWAVFETIYNWNAKRISKKIWVDITILKLSILDKNFVDELYNNTYWGIWLKHWNKSYLNAVKRWKLTKKDIDNIAKEWGWFQHNNVYWKGWFDEVWWWKRVLCWYDILLYWIEKWVFWSVARTFIPEPGDKFANEVSRYLKQIHFHPYTEILAETPFKKIALNKASKINMDYKIKWN